METAIITRLSRKVDHVKSINVQAGPCLLPYKSHVSIVFLTQEQLNLAIVVAKLNDIGLREVLEASI